MIKKMILKLLVCSLLVLSADFFVFASDQKQDQTREQEDMQEKFNWWPTDAKPAPVQDPNGGYWWWPKSPGSTERLWGNRGYCFVRKMIFDYKQDELPAPKPQELRASLLIKKIIKNVKVYFNYDKAALRSDTKEILASAVKALQKNPEASILITGNCDVRGPEGYNLKLGKKRANAVKQFMFDSGIPEDRIRIVSRGKLDAVAPVTDLKGMQKDRNAQFMIAEVEEVMLPYAGPGSIPEEATQLDEGKYIQEEQEVVEGQVKVSTKEYIVKKGDTLSKIAQKEYGKAYRWKYLYELNKDKIKEPNKLKIGQKIIIPVE
ncbi:MAG: OmpA family protein [Candidatus Omnitrophota bacterium]